MAFANRKPTRFRALLVALAGATMLVFVAVMAFRSLRSLAFREVDGTVLAKRIGSVVSGNINLHTPVIEYAYVVAGVPYRNSVYNLADEDGTEKWAESILRNYRVGAACTVYYDASNPQLSALSVGATAKAVWIMILASLLGSIALIKGVLAFRLISSLNVIDGSRTRIEGRA
jgi:hypothetical protein